MFKSRLIFCWGILTVICTQAIAQIPQIVIDSKGHSARISNIHYSADGTQIVSISEDKTIKIWDVESGKMVRKYESQIGDGFEGMFYASALSPDGKLLAVAGYKVNSEKENYILIVDLAKNSQVGTAIGHSDVINSLAFNAAGTFLASGGADNSVKIWRVNGADQLPLVTTLNTSGPVSCVSFNPKTQDLAVAQDSRDVILFGLAGLDQSIQKFTPKVWKHHKGVVDKVLFSPDGQFLVSSSFENELVLWRTDGQMLKEFGKLANPIHAVAFSSDSKILVGLDITGAGSSWGVPNGNKFSDFRGHDNTVFCAAFSPLLSNYIVASAGGINNEILLWNPINGMTIRKIKGKGNAVQALAFGNGLELFVSQEAVKNNKPSFKTRFDFASLTMDRSPNLAGVAPRKTSPDISQTSENSLALPKGKNIQTDPGEDGRILDFQSLNDGNIVVASDFSVKMFDRNGLPLKEFVGHFGAVRSIASTADGTYLATGGEDQTIILWRLADTGYVPTLRHVFPDEEWAEFFSSLPVDSLTSVPTRKAWTDVIAFLKKEGVKTYREIEQVYASVAEIVIPFATLFVADDNEWVCWTPKGYFACSSNGGQYFGWHINRGIRKLADYYSAEQFFEILYRPKEVAKSIQQGKRVEEIIRDSGERLFDLTKLHRPSAAFFDIRVITRATDLLKYEKGKIYTQAKQLPLMVEVYDGGGGVKEVNIFQNDKLIITDKDVKTKGEGDKVTKTYEVEMVNEVNEFKVVVVNFQKIESRPDYLTVEYKGEILVTSTLHMLAVGINKYQNEAYNLNYAQPDAKSLVTKLNERGKKLFKEINRIEIYDEDATRENIVMAFKTMVTRAKPEDVFLFYYAGHGTLDEEHNDEYYLVPTNITKLYGDPEQLQKKGISATELRELLTQIKSQKQVILMDACHSGGALKSLNVRAAATDEKAIIQLARSSGVIMLASSGTKQFATEFEELKHGVFTYALVEALEGKADTGDKKITVNELKFYMEERVPELTKKYGGKTQYPTGYITGNDFPLSLLE
jgi:WD40 repeat protein